jgi:hypothetical protein
VSRLRTQSLRQVPVAATTARAAYEAGRWQEAAELWLETAAGGPGEPALLGDPGLRRELLQLAAQDQAARRAWLDDPHANEIALRDTDARCSARLRAIVTARGWPGRSLVGGDGATAAWLLAQHADADRPLQRLCLAALERAVHTGEADPEDLAFLTDRVAVAEGRPQRYGTQFNDRREPEPIEDPETVDDRRRAIGLSPLAEYTRHMRALYDEPKR